MTQNNDKSKYEPVIAMRSSGVGLPEFNKAKDEVVIVTSPTGGNSSIVLKDLLGKLQSSPLPVFDAKPNEATNLINMLTGYEQEEVKPASIESSIPCGYKEPISEGKTLTCGNTYRGETFYCRDCMKAMMTNAHEVANSMAEVMLVAFNDHAITGSVSQSTIDAMGNVLAAIGCVNVEDSDPVVQQ